MRFQSPDSSVLQTPNSDAPADAGHKRDRGMRNFLTWSFFLAQAAAATEFLGGAAKAAEADGADAKKAPLDASAAKFAPLGVSGKGGATSDASGAEAQKPPAGAASPSAGNPEASASAPPQLPAVDGATAAVPAASSGGGGGSSQSFDAGTLIVVSATQVDINISTPINLGPVPDAVTQAPDVVTNLVPQLVESLNDVISPLTQIPIVGDLLDGVLDLAGDVATVVTPVVEAVDDVLANVVGTVDGVLGIVPETVADVTGAVTDIVGIVTPALGAVADTVDGVLDTITQPLGIVADLGDGVLTVLDEPLALVGDLTNGVADIASEVTELVTDTVGVTVDVAGDVLGGVIQVTDTTVDAVSDVAESALGLVDTVLTGVDAPLGLAGNVVGGVTNIVLNVTDTIATTVDVAGEVVESVVQRADAALDDVVNLTGGAIETVADIGQPTLDLVTNTASGVIDITGGLLDATQALPLLTSVSDVAENTSAGLLDFVFETAEAVSESISETPDLLANVTTAVLGDAAEPVAPFVALVDNAAETLDSSVETVIDVAETLTDTALETAPLNLGQVFEDVINIPTSAAEDLASSVVETPLTIVEDVVFNVVENPSEIIAALPDVTDIAPILDGLGIEAVTAADIPTTVVETVPSLLQTLGIAESDIAVDVAESPLASGGALSFLTDTANDAGDLLFSGEQYTDLNIALRSPADASDAGHAQASQEADVTLLGSLLGQSPDVDISLGFTTSMADTGHHGHGRGWLDFFN